MSRRKSGPPEKNETPFASNLGALQTKLGYTFTSDPSLLTKALSRGSDHERMEFLGDSVLNVALQSLLFHTTGTESFQKEYPDATLKEVAQLRSKLRSNDTLTRVANTIGLGEHIDPKHRHIRGMLSDTLEAVLGAIYLDAGQKIEPVERFVEKHWASRIRLKGKPPREEQAR